MVFFKKYIVQSYSSVKVNLPRFTMLYFLVFIISSGCMVGLRPELVKNNPNSLLLETKGKALLGKAWEVHGIDSLLTHNVYQVIMQDEWKGVNGRIGRLWPQKTTKLSLKCVPFTFDTQIEMLDGKDKGLIAGQQSWNYYEMKGDGSADFSVELDKKTSFGMAAYQYFIELVGRMNGAEIIRYGGEKEFRGQKYYTVFVTWIQEEKTKECDQYLLYIHQETNRLELASYTIRDNYMKIPGSQMFFGSIEFSDFRNVQGFNIPHVQTVYLNEPNENQDKFLHQMRVDTFLFDSFQKDKLYPNKDIKYKEDKK